MDSLARALWVSRLLLALLTIVPAALATWFWPPAGVLLVGTLLVQAVGVVRLRAYLAAVRSGASGEILLAGGQRVPLAVIQRYLTLEKVEQAVGAVVAVTLMGLAWNQLLIAVAAMVALLMQLVLLAVRWSSWQQQRAYQALMARRPAEALRVLRRLRVSEGPLAAALAVLRSSALMRLGESAAAERTLMDQWSGAYDPTSALLSVVQLGRGETELARAWVAAHRDDPSPNRYQTYLRALVGGHLALVDGTLPDAVPELSAAREQVPAYQGRELDLLRAAGLHLGGRAGDAAAVLASVDHLDDEVWRVRAQPQLWATIEQLRAGRAPMSVPAARAHGPGEGAMAGDVPEADPFAAPRADEPPPAVKVGRQVGAIPVEVAGLTGRRGRAVTWLLRVLTGLLLILSLPLGLLLVPSLVAPDPQRDTAVLAVLAAVFGVVALVSTREGVLWGTGRGERGIVLADGRLLSEEGRRYWWMFDAQAVLAVGVLGVLPVIELSLMGTVMSGALLLLLAGLTALGLRQHRRVRTACGAAHFDPPGHTVAPVMANLTHQGAGWLFLAYLVDGREGDAAAYLDKHLALAPGLEELGLWVRAGRGAVDLDQLLQRPTPTLGSRFRLAVACRLAALHHGAAHRLADDVTAARVLADDIPNRFGALLHRVNHAVQHQADPAGAARYATSHRHELRSGAWARTCWPQLLAPIPGVDDGPG